MIILYKIALYAINLIATLWSYLTIFENLFGEQTNDPEQKAEHDVTFV